MPCSAITNQNYFVIRVSLREFIQEHIHAFSIAIGHDEKEALSGHRLDSPISIPVFSNVMARHRRSESLPTPTICRFVYPSEACFILKHQTHIIISFAI